MSEAEFIESVRADLRSDIAARRDYHELVEAIEDSRLWERLTVRADEGPCTECGYITERIDPDDNQFVCEDCAAEGARQQAEDHRLDDPRHGQAAGGEV